MRTAARGRRIVAMAEPRGSVRIMVELEPNGEPIRGSIEHADGRREAFWSWLELMQTLQTIADNSAPPPRAQPRTARAQQGGGKG